MKKFLKLSILGVILFTASYSIAINTNINLDLLPEITMAEIEDMGGTCIIFEEVEDFEVVYIDGKWYIFVR